MHGAPLLPISSPAHRFRGWLRRRSVDSAPQDVGSAPGSFEGEEADGGRGAVSLPISGLLVGLAAILALQGSGAVAGARAALEEMGFDPDRATLIAALTVAGIAAGLAALVAGRRAVPVLVGFAALAAVFGATFLDETSAALAVRGPQGFDPGGWVATLVTLLIAGLVTGWSMATLSLEVRRWLLAGWTLVRAALAHRAPSRTIVLRTIVPIVLVVLVAGVLPTFADMINYTPDVAMTKGGLAAAAPLVGGESGSLPGASGQTAAQSDVPPAAVTVGAIASARPWAAAPPVGEGRIVRTTLPAPWSRGRETQSSIWFYLPPGYASGVQRYPVLYTVPWAFTNWDLGIHVSTLLDQAITSGAIPPSIVAFIDLAGGPFPTSECADSFDGQQHADTYVAKTVVAYVDSHFRTIASPGGRTLLGFSQGGFCAANLLLRHPTVFHQAIVFSGYFEAGLNSGQTVNAWQPWGHVPSLIAANSPLLTADRLPAAQRRQLFWVLSAQPDEGVFGQQASAFARVLVRDGYPSDFLWNRLGHAWAAVRQEFVPALQAVAERQVQARVLP